MSKTRQLKKNDSWILKFPCGQQWLTFQQAIDNT